MQQALPNIQQKVIPHAIPLADRLHQGYRHGIATAIDHDGISKVRHTGDQHPGRALEILDNRQRKATDVIAVVDHCENPLCITLFPIQKP